MDKRKIERKNVTKTYISKKLSEIHHLLKVIFFKAIPRNKKIIKVFSFGFFLSLFF